MEQNTSPAKSGIQLGVLFGVIVMFELVLGFVLNIDAQNNKAFGLSINFLNLLILPIVFIVMGCNNYKNKINSGYISFGECLKIGVTICVIAGLVSSLFSATFSYIFPEYFAEIFRKAEMIMRRDNPQMTEDQIAMSVSIMKKFSNPAISVPTTIIIYAFLGLIYSLIIGAIVKNERPQSI